MTEQVRQIKTLKDVIDIEYNKCKADPVYFISKLCYIQAEGGRVVFPLYEFQKKLVHVLNKYDRTIVLKSRQLGISTICACYALWLILFHTDQKVVTVAPDREKAKLILDKISFAYDNLPSWLIEKCNAKKVNDSKHELVLKNGSSAKAVSGSSKGARGLTANFLILDEAAFIDNAHDLWASAQQTLSNSKGRAIVLSTPNGDDGFFQPMWDDAEMQENDFVPIRLPWNVHPGHDKEWREKQDKELGKRLAKQECECEFLSSGNTYFEPEDIAFYKDMIDSSDNIPIDMYGPNKDVWVWEHAIPGRNYMVIVDTARGDGSDNSGIEVIDIFSGNQVAEYRGGLEPKLLAKLAVSLAIIYNSALLIVENVGLGHETVSFVQEENYNKIYFSPKGETDNVNEYLKKYFENDPSKMTAGFTTSTKTRPMILASFKSYVGEREIKIRSKRLHGEMKAFIWGKDGKPKARSGQNDDLIFCYAIGMYLRDSALEYRAHGIELEKATLMAITKTSPIAALPVNQHQLYQKQWTMNVYGKQEDFSWLVR